MATCEECLHNFVCWKSMQVEKDNLDCSDFANRSKYVVREKGEWVECVVVETDTATLVHWECPACGIIVDKDSDNFCPNCGADMRIEEQNRAREENG